MEIAMVLLYVLFAVFCTPVYLQDSGVFERHGCPDGWVSFEGSCYLFEIAGMDWAEATHSCAAHYHGNLVVIESKQEHTFLRSFCKEIFKGSNQYVWIGATDDEVEGIWTWYTDHRHIDAGYHSWHPGEPDNVANQDCGCLFSTFNFDMADAHCEGKAHYICERNLTLNYQTGIIG